MIDPKAKRLTAKAKSGFLRVVGQTSGLGKKRAVRRAPKGRFTLVYNGLDDPDAATVKHIANALKPAKVVEVLPGTLKVEGVSFRIKRMADRFDSWSLSPEGVLSDRSPVETRMNPYR